MAGRPAGCTGKLVRLPVWKGGHGHAKERIEGAVLCFLQNTALFFMFNLEHLEEGKWRNHSHAA